jgi:hypothetical protein
VGSVALVLLDRHWGWRESLSDWFFLCAAALFGFIPLVASVTAMRNPRRAGFLFLFSAPFAWAAAFLTQIDRLRYGMILWYVLLWYSFLATLIVFLLPGSFWLGTHKFNWRPIRSRPESVSRRRKILGLALTCVLLWALATVGAVILAILIHPFFADCSKSPPLSKLRPGQMVFVAKIVGTLGPCAKYSRHHECDGAVAVVQEKFWGIHSRVVLLTGGYFEKSETYLIDGVRYGNGPLTRFLPIVSFTSCNHSARLKDAEVDLRMLRDKSRYFNGLE